MWLLLVAMDILRCKEGGWLFCNVSRFRWSIALARLNDSLLYTYSSLSLSVVSLLCASEIVQSFPRLNKRRRTEGTIH